MSLAFFEPKRVPCRGARGSVVATEPLGARNASQILGLGLVGTRARGLGAPQVGSQCLFISLCWSNDPRLVQYWIVRIIGKSIGTSWDTGAMRSVLLARQCLWVVLQSFTAAELDNSSVQHLVVRVLGRDAWRREAVLGVACTDSLWMMAWAWVSNRTSVLSNGFVLVSVRLQGWTESGGDGRSVPIDGAASSHIRGDK